MRRKHPDQDDAMYLSMRQGRMTLREIAEACNVSVWTVHHGIRRARDIEAETARIARVKEQSKAREPELELWFGASCKPLKLLTCADVHPGGPIPKGSSGCCGAEGCYQSGQDHHPALQRSPLTDPKPEPKPTAKPLTRERKGKRKKRAAAKAA